MDQGARALAVGLSLSLGPITALAQATAPTPPSASPPARPGAVSPAPAAADKPVAATEVVVTATKRSERLQKVPLSVTVVDSKQLARQNINQVTDLVRSAPALNSAGPFGALSIRGIGSISFSRSAEGSVGVVVDNVALAGASTNPPQLFDVARAEVLEGPQGTLFGADSSAGVINIVTNAPDPSKYEVIVHTDLGTLGNYVTRDVVNIPLSSTAALRVAGSYNQTPEVQYNRENNSWGNDQDSSGRARLLWQPNSDVTVNIIGDYTRSAIDGGAPWTIYAATPGSELSRQLAKCGVAIGPNNDQGCVNDGNKNTTENFGVSGQVDYQLGDYTLSSISAYRGVREAVPAYDVDSIPVYILNQTGPSNTDNESQEFRLTSPKGGRVDYVAGLYFFHSDFNGSTEQLGPLLTYFGLPFLLGQTLSTTTSSTQYAAFGQATWHVTPAFRVNLGLRLGDDDVNAQTTGALSPGAVAAISNISGVNASTSGRYASYRAGVSYDVLPTVMAYASYTLGYKGPAVNDQGGGPGVPLVVRPEIPHAAEIGVKSNLLGGRLGANVALFYTKVDDFQAQFFDPAIAQFVFNNAPSLTTQGVELNVFGQPVRGLTLNSGAIFDEARYGDGYLVSCSQLQTRAQGCDPVYSAAGVKTGSVDNAGGNMLVGAPKWKFNISGEYVMPVTDRYDGFVQADAVYTSRENDDAAYDPIDIVSPALIVGGRAGVRTADGRYSIAIFTRNMFNTFRPTARFATPIAAELLDQRSYAQFVGPESRRVIGVSLDARF